VSQAAKGVADELKELNMDAYDDESDEDAAVGRLFGGGKMTHHDGNEEDPYMTIKDSDDDEEEEEPDDLTLKDTDLVILAVRTDEDVSHLEVWVYEEAGVTGNAETNLYVHHDVLLPAFPLCVEWMNCAPKSGTDEVNCAAIGTMYPGIEIWDLDCVDAVEPMTTLGGYSEDAIKSAGKKKKGKESKAFKGGSHEDAVMGLSWNRQFRNVLASASADKTVKIWDIATETAKTTLNHHKDKVQACEWNPVEATVLLTGSYDKTAQVVDVRAPESASLKWKVGADVECAIWHATEPTQFIVSNEEGMVMCFDTRMGSNSDSVFNLQAHDKATTGLSMSSGAPGLLVTCSTDKMVKLWDLSAGKPSMLSQHSPQVGAIFACSFSPSVPYLVATAGSKGTVVVWDIMSEAAVRSAHGASLERYYRVVSE